MRAGEGELEHPGQRRGGILTSRRTALIALIYKLRGFEAANGTGNGEVAKE